MTAADPGDLFVITQPRDLAPAGRILRSVLALFDRINPMLAVSQPAELEMDVADRVGQVAAILADRDTRVDQVNADRMAKWAARYRDHSLDVPLQLPAWDRKFPAADKGEPTISIIRVA
jgi:hypothetical protein